MKLDRTAYRQGWTAREATVRARCPYRDRDRCESWEAGYQDWQRKARGLRLLYRPTPRWTDLNHLHEGERSDRAGAEPQAPS